MRNNIVATKKNSKNPKSKPIRMYIYFQKQKTPQQKNQKTQYKNEKRNFLSFYIITQRKNLVFKLRNKMRNAIHKNSIQYFKNFVKK